MTAVEAVVVDEAEVKRDYSVRDVFSAQKTHQPHARLTSAPRTVITARLNDGYSVEDLIDAIDGCWSDDWCSSRGKTEVAWSLHSKNVDRFISLKRSPTPKQMSLAERLAEAARAAEEEERGDEHNQREIGDGR